MTLANFSLDKVWIFHSTIQSYGSDYDVWGEEMKDQIMWENCSNYARNRTVRENILKDGPSKASLDDIWFCFMIFGLGSWIVWGVNVEETSIMLTVMFFTGNRRKPQRKSIIVKAVWLEN